MIRKIVVLPSSCSPSKVYTPSGLFVFVLMGGARFLLFSRVLCPFSPVREVSCLLRVSLSRKVGGT